MMKGFKFISLMFMIWSSAVFIKFAPIKPFFEEHPLAVLGIFLLSALVYKIADGEC